MTSFRNVYSKYLILDICTYGFFKPRILSLLGLLSNKTASLIEDDELKIIYEDLSGENYYYYGKQNVERLDMMTLEHTILVRNEHPYISDEGNFKK